MSKQIDIAERIATHAVTISNMNDVNKVIEENARFASALVGADRCSLWLYDEERDMLGTRVAEGTDRLHIPVSSGLVGACFSSSVEVLAASPYEDPRFSRTHDISTGYTTTGVLCAPMLHNGKAIGVLQLLNKPDGFQPADVALAKLAAYFSAGSIYAELAKASLVRTAALERELELAHQVQAGLLPSSSNELLAEMEIWFSCVPAREVGGDFLDVCLNPVSHSLGLSLGDVAGKGLGPAVLMASIQMLLRSLMRKETYSLDHVAATVNQSVFESTSSAQYSTLFCARIELESGRCAYFNAGHIPGLVIRRTGGATFLETTGLPIGLFAVGACEVAETVLFPGDRLIIVSDGITEAENPAEAFWGLTNLQKLAETLPEGSSSDVGQAVRESLETWTQGAPQQDDSSILVYTFFGLPAATIYRS